MTEVLQNTINQLTLENSQLKNRLSKYGEAPSCQTCLSPLVHCEKGEEGAIRQDGDDIMSRGFMKCESCASEKIMYSLREENDKLTDEIRKLKRNNFTQMTEKEIEKALEHAEIYMDGEYGKLKKQMASLLMRMKQKVGEE